MYDFLPSCSPKLLLCRTHSRENTPLEGEPFLLASEVLEVDAVGEHRRGSLRHSEHAESAAGHGAQQTQITG